MVANRRVVVHVRWWFCPEPYGSGFWAVFCWRDRSDHTAHAEH